MAEHERSSDPAEILRRSRESMAHATRCLDRSRETVKRADRQVAAASDLIEQIRGLTSRHHRPKTSRR